MNITVTHQAFEKTPVTVALVNVGERTGDIALDLEYAYLRTQNIHGSWSRDDLENNPDYSEDVTLLTELPVVNGQTYGLRSTSMGDMMTLDTGEKYKVGMAGFELT
tara:strand:+ start:1087 stop:1404 length:318 start_codon:yes stop_codon:yes gene_type:complete